MGGCRLGEFIVIVMNTSTLDMSKRAAYLLVKCAQSKIVTIACLDPVASSDLCVFLLTPRGVAADYHMKTGNVESEKHERCLRPVKTAGFALSVCFTTKVIIIVERLSTAIKLKLLYLCVLSYLKAYG